MAPASVMKRFNANGASIKSDFHRASPEMALLRLCQITNESTQTENCCYSLNRELRRLWNSEYHNQKYVKKRNIESLFQGTVGVWEYSLSVLSSYVATTHCDPPCT